MQNCVKTCTLFYIILLNYFFVLTFTLIYNQDLSRLNILLNNKQKKIYDLIKRERCKHFFIGLLIGGILGYLIILTKISKKIKFCLSGIVLIFFTTIIYYILPKTTYMIHHLRTEKQKKAWMEVNSNFIKKKIAGFLLAIIIYFGIPFIF